MDTKNEVLTTNGHAANGQHETLIIDAAELKRRKGLLSKNSSSRDHHSESDPPGSPIGPRTTATPGNSFWKEL